jgi:hypothetical protein
MSDNCFKKDKMFDTFRRQTNNTSNNQTSHKGVSKIAA